MHLRNLPLRNVSTYQKLTLAVKMVEEFEHILDKMLVGAFWRRRKARNMMMSLSSMRLLDLSCVIYLLLKASFAWEGDDNV